MDTSEEDLEASVQVLTSQPSEEKLVQVLRQFQISSSSPTSSVASVIFALVNTTLPELWRSLHANIAVSKETVRLIIECLSSVAGVNALLMRLDQLQAQRQQTSTTLEPLLEDVLQVLSLILEGERFNPVEVIELCRRDNAKGKMMFNEYVALVGGSKILNIVSKAAVDLDTAQNFWIVDGKRYSKWFGERIGLSIIRPSDGPEVAVLIGKALSIGYPGILSTNPVNDRLFYRRSLSAYHSSFAFIIASSYKITSHTTSYLHETFIAVSLGQVCQLHDTSNRDTLVGCRSISCWGSRWSIAWNIQRGQDVRVVG
jgi:hypothetical protein